MTNILEISQLYETILAADLGLARATFKHSGQKGSSLERSIQALLQKILPEKFGVSEGIIIDSTGYVSPQIDLIIYDKNEAQLFYKSDSTIAVPIEYVFAIVEVKAQLNKDGYNRFFETQRAIKNCDYKFWRGMGSESWTYMGYGRDWINPRIASILVAFEAPESTYDWALADHENHPINDCIDMIFCPESFSIHRESEYGADLFQGRIQRLVSVPSRCLYYFWGCIAKAAAHWKIVEPVAIYNYFKKATGDEPVYLNRQGLIDPDNVSGRDLLIP